MKEKHIKKKTGILIFAAALWIGAAEAFCAEAAAESTVPDSMSEETYALLNDNTIEWGEISDIVKYRNPTYKVYADRADETLSDTRYAVSDDIIDLKDQLDEVNDSIDTIKTAQRQLLNAGIGTNSEAYQKLEAGLTASQSGRKQLKSALSQMGSAARSVTYGKKSADLSLTPARDQLISVIEGLVISYKTLETNAEMLTEQAGLYDSLYQSSITMVSQGLMTASESESYKNQAESARLQLKQLESGMAQLKGNILIQCGYDSGADVVIADLPAADRNYLAGRDTEADKKTAIAVNDEVQSAAKVSSYSGDVLKYREMNESAAEGSAANAFDEVKAELEKEALLTEASDTSLRKAELLNNSAETRYALGMLGRSEYESYRLQYIAAKATAKLNELNLHQAIENYKYTVRGVS